MNARSSQAQTILTIRSRTRRNCWKIQGASLFAFTTVTLSRETGTLLQRNVSVKRRRGKRGPENLAFHGAFSLSLFPLNHLFLRMIPGACTIRRTNKSDSRVGPPLREPSREYFYQHSRARLQEVPFPFYFPREFHFLRGTTLWSERSKPRRLHTQTCMHTGGS